MLAGRRSNGVVVKENRWTIVDNKKEKMMTKRRRKKSSSQHQFDNNYNVDGNAGNVRLDDDDELRIHQCFVSFFFCVVLVSMFQSNSSSGRASEDEI